MRTVFVVGACCVGHATHVVASAVAALIGPERLLARAGYAAVDTRLVTGLVVTGAAGSPVVYVTSSDPRIPDYVQREHLPIDTNSGVVSVLTESRRDGRAETSCRGFPAPGTTMRRTVWRSTPNAIVCTSHRAR